MVGKRIDFPERLWGAFMDGSHRFRVAYGGRGSAKSWAAAIGLIIKSMQGKLRILCAREFQRSISDSVHHLLETQIDRLGYSANFDVQKTTIVCLTTGSQFIFGGLKHNITSLKSLEGIDICWVEEAEAVSEESWAVLVPTIRKPDSEIWVTFNPDQESDPTYQRFIPGQPKYDDARTVSVRVSWRDNPCLPDVLKAELEHLRRTDPEAYMHVWEGCTWTRSEVQVMQGKWKIDAFSPVYGRSKRSENWDGPYFGADWGFANDPTVLLKMWIHERVLYIEYEAHMVGCEIRKTAELFDRVPGSRKAKIRADNARPETISHVRADGFNIVPCEKWPGSVEDGIAFLRSFDAIVIHPRCKETILEAKLYRYRTDRLTGDVLPEVLDKHNHCWDAARYGLEPMIQRKNHSIFDSM